MVGASYPIDRGLTSNEGRGFAASTTERMGDL